MPEAHRPSAYIPWLWKNKGQRPRLSERTEAARPSQHRHTRGEGPEAGLGGPSPTILFISTLDRPRAPNSLLTTLTQGHLPSLRRQSARRPGFTAENSPKLNNLIFWKIQRETVAKPQIRSHVDTCSYLWSPSPRNWATGVDSGSSQGVCLYLGFRAGWATREPRLSVHRSWRSPPALTLRPACSKTSCPVPDQDNSLGRSQGLTPCHNPGPELEKEKQLWLAGPLTANWP